MHDLDFQGLECIKYLKFPKILFFFVVKTASFLKKKPQKHYFLRCLIVEQA